MNTREQEEELDYSGQQIKCRKPLHYSLRGFILILGLACLFFPGMMKQIFLFDSINQGTLGIINEVLHNNTRLFFIVSAIKAAIAIIEGSSVGILIADMQVGDIVQPAYNLIDFVWRIILYSLFILGIYRILLEIEFFGWGIPIIGIGLFMLGFWWGNERFRRIKIWGLRITVIGLFFGYFVPLTLLTSHLLNRHFTAHYKQIQEQRIYQLQAEVEEYKTKFVNLRTDIIPETLIPWRWDVHMRFKALNLHINQIGVQTTRVFQEASGTLINFLAIIFLEVLFFPIFTAFILYKAGSAIFRKLYNTVPVFTQKIITRETEA